MKHLLLYLDKGANSKPEIPCRVSSDHQLHLDFINKDACTAIMQISPLAIGELRFRTADRHRQRQKGILNKGTNSMECRELLSDFYITDS